MNQISKVYAVSHGDYDDYHIVAIFAREGDAEDLKEQIDDAFIEEFELFQDVLQACQYEVWINMDDGSEVSNRRRHSKSCTTLEPYTWLIENQHHPRGTLTAWNISIESALALARNKRTEILEERQS